MNQWINGCNKLKAHVHYISIRSELQRIVKMDQIPNSEYIRFPKFYEYWIIRFLKIERIPNTKSTIRSQLFEYRILNNNFWKLTDTYCHKYFFHKLNLWQKEIRRILFFVFVLKWSLFLYFFLTSCFLKTLKLFGIRWQLFGYSNIIRKLQMDRIPNTNSTIRSQLFEYRIIRIICCNSGGEAISTQDSAKKWRAKR